MEKATSALYKSIALPGSYKVTVGCDLCYAERRWTLYETYVNGFSDAHLAIRHVKGFLIASEGWRSLSRDYKDSKGVIHTATAMVCPLHKKEG